MADVHHLPSASSHVPSTLDAQPIGACLGIAALYDDAKVQTELLRIARDRENRILLLESEVEGLNQEMEKVKAEGASWKEKDKARKERRRREKKRAVQKVEEDEE